MRTPQAIRMGLKCCKEGERCSLQCPYFKSAPTNQECTSKLAADALALIRRQEKEHKKLLDAWRRVATELCGTPEAEPDACLKAARMARERMEEP